MTAGTLVLFAFLAVSTSFIAGVFGMAGGMLLMGALLLFLPVPQAMILHGVTQATSNGWRATIWRAHIDWRIVLRYAGGLAVAALLFASLHIVPDERIVLIMIGLVPLVGLILPANLAFDAQRGGQAEACGFLCTALQFLSGVSGPTLDLFFVRTPMDRRAVVATKAACQVITHLSKIAYFGSIVATASSALGWWVFALAVGSAILGTSLSRTVLERMSDQNFRRYTGWIVASLGLAYCARGVAGYL